MTEILKLCVSTPWCVIMLQDNPALLRDTSGSIPDSIKLAQIVLDVIVYSDQIPRCNLRRWASPARCNERH